MSKQNVLNQSGVTNQREQKRWATGNDILKKLYVLTKNRSKIFKHVVKIHKNVFSLIRKGELKVQQNRVNVDKQISQYKSQNKLKIDEPILLQCASIHDIMMGNQSKNYINQQKSIKIQQKMQEKLKEKQLQESSLMKKQQEYVQKVKQYQKQKQFYDRKKKQQAIKKQQMLKHQEQKTMRQQQIQAERQRQQKRKRLQQGLKQIQQRRKQRQFTIKQLSLEHRRSKSMKALAHNSLPRYIELQRQYLQRQRQKAQQFKQHQKQKRQSMQLKIDQIKNHEREYIERIKAKLGSSSGCGIQHETLAGSSSVKVRSEFNTIKMRDEQEEQKHRDRVMRRKQFQSKLRAIPISIDVNKRKQKQIEIDKTVNKQKYILLGKKRLDDEIIYKEFKNFQVHVDPKIIGNNYLNQIKQINQRSKSQRIGKEMSEKSITQKPQKAHYVNYLEELRQKNQNHKGRRSQSKLAQTDELLKLAEKGQHLLRKNHQDNKKIYETPTKPTMKQSKQPPLTDRTKTMLVQNENEASKSITEKIVQYERKVLKKVNDLKRISHYHQSLQSQKEIDDLYSKVLNAKLSSIELAK